MCPYMWNLKQDTNEPIYETETKSETQRIDWCCKERCGVREGRSGSLELADANWYLQRMNKQQGPSVQHRELYSVSCDNP